MVNYREWERKRTKIKRGDPKLPHVVKLLKDPFVKINKEAKSNSV